MFRQNLYRTHRVAFSSYNNDLPDDLFGSNERLPGISNGMNKYQAINNVVFLSALNRNPGHFAFLKHQGLDADFVKFATSCQSAYQAIMRCSIRDPENMEQKTVIVSKPLMVLNTKNGMDH